MTSFKSDPAALIFVMARVVSHTFLVAARFVDIHVSFLYKVLMKKERLLIPPFHSPSMLYTAE